MDLKNGAILIYGAGTNGTQMLHLIQDGGGSVAAFIDSDAARIKSVCGKAVYTVQDAVQRYVHTDIPVIVAVADFFLHGKIARQLNNVGFSHIIYKTELVTQKRSAYAARLNSVYDAFLAGRICQVEDIPKYCDEAVKSNFCAVIGSEGEDVTAYVPTELFKINIGVNGSLYGAKAYNELFAMFESGESNSIEAYKSYVSSCKGGVSEDRLEAIIARRERIFMSLRDAVDFNTDYFANSPVEAKYTNGVFNIIDGRHRACFLAHRGACYIPCRMSHADYEKWRNPIAADALQWALQNTELDIPVNAPDFFASSGGFYCDVRMRMRRIVAFLADRDILINGKSVALARDDGGYYSRCFSRMGAKVARVRSAGDPLIKLVDAIEYTDDIDSCDISELRGSEIWFFPANSFASCCDKTDTGNAELIMTESEKGQTEMIRATIGANYSEECICNTVFAGKTCHLLAYTRR